MNERINSISDLRFRSDDSDNDMGRFRRRQLDEKIEKEAVRDFDSIFQKELKKESKKGEMIMNNNNNNYEVTLKNYTCWDEELGSYILTEEGKKLTERDMINIIGNMEHGNRETIVSVWDILEPESNEQSMRYPMCGWKY